MSTSGSQQSVTLERRTRLTYVLLFRVVVISLLLGARLVEDWTAPAGTPPLGFTVGLALVVLCYASAIAFSIWVSRTSSGAEVERVAATQIVLDLFLTTALVHLSGGVESQLAFVYLIVVAGAGLTFPRGALYTALAAVALFTTLVLLRRFGIVPRVAQSYVTPPRELVRALVLNGLAVVATGVLAARLGVEIARAGDSLDRKSAQLEDLATLYADVVRSLSSGLVTLSIDGRVATVNNAAATILEMEEDDLVGRPLEASIPGVGPLLTAPRVVRREEVAFLDRTGKPRQLGITVSPLTDSADRQIGQIVTFQDLTELRAMEEAVTRQKRLAAIGRLAAGVAHEIRNPLAAISGSIELLVSSGIGEASADSKELAQIVLREAERLNGLITQLLDFARPRTTDLQLLDLGETVTELVQVFQHDRRLGDTRVELSVAGVVKIDADAAQLRQVVWNLFRNAAEAAPGKTIDVRVDVAGPRGRLVVSDRGPGIDDENLSRVFEPFFSTKENGTGLGLPTVNRIIEEHKGTVDLVRNEHGGISAIVLLPLHT